MILPFSVLAAVPFIMVLGNSMLIPVFPELERELSITQFKVGLLVTAFSIPAGLVIPFTGALSDHIGRTTIIFPALLLYGLGGLGAGFASIAFEQPFGWILAARIVQGIGAGGTYQIALALTGDLFDEKERPKAVGILEAANGLGKVVSPISGAALGMIIWYAPFFAYGIIAIPVAFAVKWLVKEKQTQGDKQSPGEYWRMLKDIFRDKGVPIMATYAAGAVGLFLLFGMLSFISDELELRYDLTGVIKGLYLAIPVFVMASAAFTMGILLQNKTKWLFPCSLFGLGATAAGLLGLAFLSGLFPLLAFSSVTGLGVGVMLPAINTLITGSTTSKARGLVTALYGTVRFFGVALGPPAFGLAQGLGRLPVFLTGCALALIVFALCWWLIKPKRILAPST